MADATVAQAAHFLEVAYMTIIERWLMEDASRTHDGFVALLDEWRASNPDPSDEAAGMAMTTLANVVNIAFDERDGLVEFDA